MTVLETKNLSKHFGGLRAVDDISMRVNEGDIYGIIGPNGAGKTTFFNLITATMKQTSGEVFFMGQNISKLPTAKVARLGIARTFQNIKLFKHLSVLENVKIGFHIRTHTHLFDAIFHDRRYLQDEKLAEEQGIALLEEVGLKDRMDMVAGNLPYGLQRRLEIARALALSPQLLLLDEPAAGMNPTETVELMEFVREIHAKGITVVVIEHDMKFIMNLCNHILVINSGQKLAEGNPKQVTSNPQVIEAYLGTGLQVERRRKAVAQ